MKFFTLATSFVVAALWTSGMGPAIRIAAAHAGITL